MFEINEADYRGFETYEIPGGSIESLMEGVGDLCDEDDRRRMADWDALQDKMVGFDISGRCSTYDPSLSEKE